MTKKTIEVDDDTLFTATESYILNVLLDKIIESSDMDNMELIEETIKFKDVLLNAN